MNQLYAELAKDTVRNFIAACAQSKQCMDWRAASWDNAKESDAHTIRFTELTKQRLAIDRAFNLLTAAQVMKRPLKVTESRDVLLKSCVEAIEGNASACLLGLLRARIPAPVVAPAAGAAAGA